MSAVRIFAVVQQVLATGALLLAVLPSNAQAPVNSTVRPSTNFDVTTGIGTGSSFRNVAPPDQPTVDTSRKFMWDTPESVEAFRPNKDKPKENGEPREV